MNMECEEFDILGIGDADLDIMIQVPHFPAHDEKVKGVIVDQCPGGIVSNFLCAASRFGAACAAVVRVGDDERGRLALDDLRRHGVDVSHSLCYPDSRTYFTVSCIDASGEKSMLVCMDGSTQPELADIPMPFLQRTRYVHMIGTYAELVLAVAKEKEKYGFCVSLDIERQERALSEQQVRQICAFTDIAFPNEQGLRYFTGKNEVEEGAAWMREQGCGVVVATLGAKGVYVCAPEESFYLPAFQVEVKDTTGAGDTFNACFLASRVKGYSLRDCALLATAAAALQIQSVGARKSMPDEVAARYFLKDRGILTEGEEHASRCPHC